MRIIVIAIILLNLHFGLLAQNEPTLDVVPNTFVDTTSFIFTLSTSDTVSLVVYNFFGEVIDSLIKEQLIPQGTQTIMFVGDTLPIGQYLVSLDVDTHFISKKFVKVGVLVIGIEDNKLNELNIKNYPNPFSYYGLNISYEITRNAYVHFSLFDYTGKEMLTINKGYKPVGKYIEHIDTNPLTPGMYFLIANINGQIQTNKIIKL